MNACVASFAAADHHQNQKLTRESIKVLAHSQGVKQFKNLAIRFHITSDWLKSD